MNRCRKERGKVGCRGIGAEKNKNGQLQRRSSCRRKGKSRGIGVEVGRKGESKASTYERRNGEY